MHILVIHSGSSSIYAIPLEFREQGVVRRYGFYGLSRESIVRQICDAKIRLPQRTVIAHLGSGCSVTEFDWKRRLGGSCQFELASFVMRLKTC